MLDNFLLARSIQIGDVLLKIITFPYCMFDCLTSLINYCIRAPYCVVRVQISNNHEKFWNFDFFFLGLITQNLFDRYKKHGDTFPYVINKHFERLFIRISMDEILYFIQIDFHSFTMIADFPFLLYSVKYLRGSCTIIFKINFSETCHVWVVVLDSEFDLFFEIANWFQ